MERTMNSQAAQRQINEHAENYSMFLSGDHWTLEHAHDVLQNDNLDLFQIAGLAKAIACFQCEQAAA